MGGRGSGRKPDRPRVEQMARLRDAGLTLAEIGERLGVTRQCVLRTLSRAGLSRPRAVACRECRKVIVKRPAISGEPRPVLCLACLGRRPDAPFCERLRAFRQAAGLTQEQLGERTGLARYKVARWECDGALPRWPDIVKLARVLGAGLLTLGLRLPEGPAMPRYGDRGE
jgi:transcriptional regulator with XRE-family HTH domain